MSRIIFFLITCAILSCSQKNSKNKQDADTVSLKNDTASVPSTDNSPTPGNSDEATVNALLKTQMGGKWRVITDKDVTEKSDYYVEDVKKERVNDVNFPFIAKGDFNGDGKMDFAALITNEEQEFGHLLARVCILPDGGKFIRYDEETGTWPSFQLGAVKKSTSISINEGEKPEKMTLGYDGIAVMMGESGSYYIVWDGKEFKSILADY